MNLIGLRLHYLRHQKHMSATALASGIVSKGYMSNIENGRKIPSVETLMYFSERLSIEAQQLLLDDEAQGNSIVEGQLASVFQSLLLEDLPKATQQFAAIEESTISSLSTEIECQFLVIKGLLALKNWQLSVFEELETAYYSGISKNIFALLDKPTKRYYLYMCGIRNVMTMKYEDAKANFLRLCQLEEPTSDTWVAAQIALAMCYISNSEFEEGIELCQAAAATIEAKAKSMEHRKVQLYYLIAFSYCWVNFYKQAIYYCEKAEQEMLHNPTGEKLYQLVTLYWKQHAYQALGKPDKVRQTEDDIFHIIMKRQQKKQMLSVNDYLPLCELIVYYGENQELERLVMLLAIIEQLESVPTDIEYGYILKDHLNGEQEAVSQKLNKLLGHSEKCNNEQLLVRIKRFASDFFENQKKYKQALTFLKQVPKQ